MAFDKRKSLQNALTYTQQGKWDRAIAEYKAILKVDPRDVTVYNNLGDLFARAGNTAEAIDQYLKLGELYRADGLSVKAIAVYKKIAKLDPARTEAYVACADLYWEQGLLGEAKIQMATVVEHYSRAGETAKLADAYKRLIQFDPTNPSIIARLADTLLRDGKREAAATEYERASQLAQAAGQVAEAKRLLQKVQDLSPATPKMTVSLAEQLLADRKVADGLDVLRRVTSAEPGNAQAWRLLGETLAAQGQTGECLSSLEHAVSVDVPESEVAQPLGRALVDAGRIEDAIALCRRVTDAGVAKGELDSGITLCRKLLEVAPQVAALHAYLAATLDSLGRTTEAVVALRDLAAVQESSGETVAAVATYRRLMALDPSDAEVRARLETLEPPELPAPETGPAAVTVHDSEEPSSVPLQEAEEPEALLPSVDDLESTLGSEDVALLLEEPSATESAILSNHEAAPSETDLARGEGGKEPSSDASDWLTQELHAIDLEQAAAAMQAKSSGLEWVPEGQTTDAEGVMSPERELEFSLEVSAGALPESSSLLDVPLVELPSASTSALADAAPLVTGQDVSREPMDEQAALIDTPAVELPDLLGEPDVAPLDLPAPATEGEPVAYTEDDADSGYIAEQLAEADVYQKYGLEEKARERLGEVVRLAPDNLTARRRLKAIYFGRGQFEAACEEILAIARALRARRDEDAALAEAREGLALVPTQKDLQQFLLAAAPAEGAGPMEASSSPPPGPVLREAVAPGPRRSPAGAAGGPAGDAPGTDGGAPPPDVPLLVDWDQTVPTAEAAQERESGSGLPDGEALPEELQALLENDEAESVGVSDGTEAAHAQAMADDVAEAEFYLSQGMTDEARAVHRRMHLREPENPAVAALADQIERAVMPTRPEGPEPASVPETPSSLEAPPDAEPTIPATSETATDELSVEFTVADATPEATPVGFVDLAAELAHELEAGDPVVPSADPGPLVNGLIKELQKGVREQLDEKDYETHYNLGIAYKEMELYDEAIQEFRLTSREPKRALECADLVGLCYLAKGQPDQAVQDLQAGLAIEGHPAEAYHNLRYDLGAAFEAQGELARALEQFEILQTEGARFLDVQTRVEALRAQLARTASPATKEEKLPRKKKISFI